MDEATLQHLQAKEGAGTITEEEYVQLLVDHEQEDADFARQMYRTAYAARLAPKQGYTYLV